MPARSKASWAVEVWMADDIGFEDEKGKRN
jgi:hypothetical protein